MIVILTEFFLPTSDKGSFVHCSMSNLALFNEILIKATIIVVLCYADAQLIKTIFTNCKGKTVEGICLAFSFVGNTIFEKLPPYPDIWPNFSIRFRAIGMMVLGLGRKGEGHQRKGTIC